MLHFILNNFYEVNMKTKEEESCRRLKLMFMNAEKKKNVRTI